MADTYSREQIKFIQLTQAQYDGLNADPVVTVKGITAIDPHTIYFTTDTHKIYKGTDQYAINVKVGDYTLTSLQTDDDIYANYMYISNTGKIFYCKAKKSGEDNSKNQIIAIGDQDTITAEIDDLVAIVGTPVAGKIVTVDADGEFQYSNAIVNSVDAEGTDTNVPTEKAVRTAITTAIGALDVPVTGGDNKVITTILETDGKISATAVDLTASIVGRSSTSAISSLTVQGALQELADAIADSTAAQKTYSLASTSASSWGANVRQAYQLVDEDGVVAGATIKIYKDSSLINVYLGNDDTTESNLSSAPQPSVVTGQGSYLNFVYQLAEDEYKVVGFNVSKLLTESQFADGLSVSNSGVVSVNIDNDSNQYVKIDSQTGAIVDTGINDAIAEAKGQAISSANAYTYTASSALSAYVDSSVGDASTYAASVSSAAQTAAQATAAADATAKANAAQAAAQATAAADATAKANAAQAAAQATAATDATNKANAAQAAAQATAAADATTKANAAQAAAQATAATDATNKANNALSSANTYTDTASSALSVYVDSSVTDAFSWYVLND